MSEELLLNDRRGNWIYQGSSLDQFFFMGAKNFDPTGIRNTDISIHGHLH